VNTERLSGLGLEPVLTTSELAEYLGVHVRAIYDLRADGRGPSGIRVGRELRYRVSDVVCWLDGLHEPAADLSLREGGALMAGRPRLPNGTFGAIQTSRLAPDRYRAWTRFRDWDGQTRQVTVTAASRNTTTALLSR